MDVPLTITFHVYLALYCSATQDERTALAECCDTTLLELQKLTETNPVHYAIKVKIDT